MMGQVIDIRTRAVMSGDVLDQIAAADPWRMVGRGGQTQPDPTPSAQVNHTAGYVASRVLTLSVELMMLSQLVGAYDGPRGERMAALGKRVGDLGVDLAADAGIKV